MKNDRNNIDINELLKTIANWKTPGLDHMQNFWLKRLA